MLRHRSEKMIICDIIIFSSLAEVAQLVEHSPEERGVTSSTLVLGTLKRTAPAVFCM